MEQHTGSGRHIAIIADRNRLRSFHEALAERLRRRPDTRVSMIHESPAAPLPASVDLFLSLEALLARSIGPRLSAPLQDGIAFEPAIGDADIVIDLCGDAPRGPKTYAVLFDGTPGEQPLIGALLAGRMPVIEVKDVEAGTVVARGTACADNAGTIVGAMENVLVRTLDLIERALDRPASMAARHVPAASNARLRDLVAFEARSLPHNVARRLYHLCCHAPHWRTCWRHVDGPGVWETRSLGGAPWNVVPDPGDHFYADPFPFVHHGSEWVFVEDLDHRTQKGVISVIPFDDGGPSGAARPVLEEDWHLSYPCVFRHGGEIWMVPESVANRSVHLYRADPFPDRWVYEATLLDRIEASDATVFEHAGAYWMTATTRDGRGSWSDCLSLFMAPDLLGPWEPHPANPVLIDAAAARPAGAVVTCEDRLFRPVQDCTNGYGTGIGLAEITRLDRESFEQRVLAVLRPEPGWPGKRLHTLNRAGRLECIDGSAHSPRSRLLAHWLQDWSGRRDD